MPIYSGFIINSIFMKKLSLMLALLAMMLMSCVQDDLGGVNKEGKENVVFDLNTMTYEGMAEMLAAYHGQQGDVEFTDGVYSKHLSVLNLEESLEGEGTESLVFRGAESDSLELTITPEYASVRMSVEGTKLAYLAYGEPEMQNEIAEAYNQLFAATRINTSQVLTRSGTGTIRINLSDMTNQMDAYFDANCSYVVEEPELSLSTRAHADTRGVYSFWKAVKSLFAPTTPEPVGETPTVNIYLMKEKGSNPLTHEMNWQVNDAIASLKDVQSNVNFKVHIVSVAFAGTYDADEDIEDFREWIQKSSYKDTEGIFVLCRWGGWGTVLGIAFLNDYNVNRDKKAYMLSTTNTWNMYVMAHEMGHVFGAEHVNLPWYQLLWKSDLMVPISKDWLGVCKHNNEANRVNVKRNLTLW